MKIKGAGVGGCDIVLQSGEQNDEDCWCLWGTLNYGFSAYNIPLITDASVREEFESGDVSGDSICHDLSSLGNCYDNAYECTISSEGFCHCHH